MSYEYLNPRVRYLKAKLLRPEQFAALLELNNLEEFINYLAETDYAQDIEKSSVEYSGYPLVEDALIRHAQRLFSHLYEIAIGEAKTLIRILLERFEVFNLKTILRGFHVGTDAEETARSLLPTILYPTAFYMELLKRDGIDGVVDYLLAVGNRFYKPLSQAYPEYEASGKLAALEMALDGFYFHSSRRTLQDMASDSAAQVRRMLGTEADILNLVYALRVIEAQVESEEKYRYILPGGERLSEEFVRELLSSPDKPSFLHKFSETYYHKALGGIEEEITANELQERLEGLLYRENCRFDPGKLFDIHLAAVFIWRLNVEVTNLRVIASGLWRSASRRAVEERLIWVEGMMPEREAVKS
jgi:V/A-type H+-transporting ATPase subunit C